MKAEIVDLESSKFRLIEILVSHIQGAITGSAAGRDFNLIEIPAVLDRINSINSKLKTIAREGDAFAAESSFRDLVVNLDAKRATILCNLAREAGSPTPNISLMSASVDRLKDELKAISAAEDALGKYIKEIGM